ncbi:MAG: HAD-IIB family hydrolase [Deltaproteobacteria bacterium]|nr:HAD-IIB family hydrolase [Deltaproteobacteria bacterium]
MVDLVIFTDLDGTLLDHHTYSYEAARPALNRIKETHTPLIMVSSKTRVEIEALQKELGKSDPFITENGGAIYIPNGYDLALPPGTVKDKKCHIIVLGLTAKEIASKYKQLARRFPVRALSQMSAAEAAELTGLTLERAKAAQAREYSEAFILTDQEISEEALTAAARDQGLQLTRGGRFYHLLAGNDKGRAVRILSDLYRRRQTDLITVGLGDSFNDVPLLAAVDRPYLVARPDGSYTPLELPALIRVPLPGPAGFNKTIMDLLG